MAIAACAAPAFVIQENELNRALRCLACSGLLALLACSAGETPVESGTRLGILHFGNGSEPQGIDPHVTTGIPEYHIQAALFEGLVSKNPYTLEPEPGVAESWTVSEDGRIYRFQLREDARWSDGQPLTAEDFRWSWWRILHPTTGAPYNYMLFPILNAEAFAAGQLTDFDQVGVRVLDERTLEVELAYPTPYFLQLLDHHSLFPVPRHVIEALGSATDQTNPWTRLEHFVGNGPFRLTSWNLNQSLTVEKNDLYWDAEQVRLNAIVFYPTENSTTEERMFRSGQLHRTEGIPVDRIPVYQAESSPALLLSPYLGTYFYNLNVTREPLDKVQVRRALNLAIDRQLLIDSALNGVQEPAYTVTPPGTLGYQPPKIFDFDPALARELLAEAGYPNGQGFPVLEILYNTLAGHQRIAEVIQQMWKTHLNIDVTLVNQEWRVYLDTMAQLDYDIARASWIGDYVDPNNFLDLWITNGGNNRVGWSDPVYDQLILRDAPAAATQAERFAIFYEAETRLMEAMPIIPLYTYVRSHLLDPRVKGMPENIMDYTNYKYVWLED